MTTIEILSGSESAWIDNTTPRHMEEDVSRVDSFFVEFGHMVATDALVASNFKLFDEAGIELVGAFRDIVIINDWDAIAGRLELHLSAPLNTREQYTFFIDGLYDAVGDSQDNAHVVVFTTNSNDAILEPLVGTDNFIQVIDRTISSAEIVPLAQEHVAYMDPADGAYNVATGTQTLTIRFIPPDVTALGQAQWVKRRALSNYETPWQFVGATFELVDSICTITLPQVSAGVYIEPGYEYQVTIGIQDSTPFEKTFGFNFLGELPNMLTNIQSVLTQMPGIKSIDAARMIYLNSLTAIDIDYTQSTTPTRAGTDFTLYSTLWQIASTGLDATGIVLGDLEVEKRGESKVDKYERLMKEAEARLFKANPKFLVKGSGNTSPHAGRDWDSSGTSRRRIGKTE